MIKTTRDGYQPTQTEHLCIGTPPNCGGSVMNKTEKKELEFTIIKNIANLSDKTEKGWRKELNIVQWGNGKPKADIRDWSEDHTKCGKGVTLTSGECDILHEALDVVGEF